MWSVVGFHKMRGLPWLGEGLDFSRRTVVRVTTAGCLVGWVGGTRYVKMNVRVDVVPAHQSDFVSSKPNKRYR